MFPVVTTERCVLRPFSADDGAALHGYLSQEEAVRFEPYGVFSRDEAAAAAVARSTDPAFVAVCELGTGELVGHLYVAPDGPADWRTWQIGYVFDPRRWGNGYATEACTALLDELVTARDAHRVVARCDLRNVRSWALMERLGMRREGLLLQAATFEVDTAGAQVWHDALCYGLLAAEWRQARGVG